MQVLVTGATGLIGNAIARQLVERGDVRVRALVRDVARARPLLPAAVALVPGDITAPQTLAPAFEGAELVYHAAGMPEQWQRDAGVFDRVNHRGTANVLAAARAAGVRRVVYTSTMDVFAAPRGGTLDETRLDPGPKPTAYEQSKLEADRAVTRAVAEGLDVVHVNPAAVYGPSPVHVGLNSFFLNVLRGALPLLPPGGVSVAWVDGVAAAHRAAAEKGATGERYLIADEHVSVRELAAAVVAAAGRPATGRPPRVPPVGPAWALRAFAHGLAPLARAFRFTPLVAPGQLSFLLWDAHVDAGRARRELGFEPLPLAEGARRTVAFLRDAGLAPR